MKKSELKKIIREMIIKETGEMSKNDLKPGGEYYDWGQQIKNAAKKLESLTKKKVKFIELKPYDKYQGPYAYLEIKNGGFDELYSTEYPDFYVLLNMEYAGDIKLLAKAINGDQSAIDKAIKNANKQNR